MLTFFKRHSKHITLCIVICLVVLFIRFCPKQKITDHYTYSKSFFAQDGTLLQLTVSYDDKYRLFYPLEDIPKDLQNAVLTYEDNTFYYHFGVNPYAVFRACWSTFIAKKRKMGASTITMQTARIVYNLNTKTISGKIKQMLYALWLEMRYSKHDILEAYLNIAPYGYNIEGVGAASLIYFQKRLPDTNLLEQMTLAVIPQNPNQRRPSTQEGYVKMQTARNALFEKLLTRNPHYADAKDFFAMPMQIHSPADLPFYTPQFIRYLDERIHNNEIHTTIDLPLQKLYEHKIKDYLIRNASKGIKNAVAMLVNINTMEAQVMVGSANFYDSSIQGQVNGIRAKRMAGSVLKSFIYGLALDKGLIHPMTLLKDTPQYFSIYAPENSDRQFSGPILAVDALIHSRNIPAISLMHDIGEDNFLNLLKTAGVANLKDSTHYGTSAAIGSIDVSVEEVTKLYAALANYGQVKTIRYIKDQPNDKTDTRILSPEASFVLWDMLTHNPPPNNAYVYNKQGSKVKIAWKTGTSGAFRDAWAAGIFGKYVLVVWIGNFSGEGNPNFGGRTAAGKLFFELINLTVKTKYEESFSPTMYVGKLAIKKVPICASTGDLPGKYCPRTTEGYFILGKSPIKTSTIHRAILIDNKTGLRACNSLDGKTHQEIFEFWPSDLLTLFEQAGIKKKIPPHYVPGCEIEDTFAGDPPHIILPVKDIVYYLQEQHPKIPLQATIDADATQIFWFIDNKFMGKSQKNETIIVPTLSGKHSVQAIDDLGRHHVSNFQVQYRQ